MKYEADIIKEIVDSRGHTKTSIHYQSECVEEWVKEAEGAYPKLCDYQSEWLNYIDENPIGNFPYVTLTDVTNATVENVVPYDYKRASLTGQTLVNISKFESNIERTSTGTSQSIRSNDVTMLKTSTTYTFIYWIESTSDTSVSNITTLDGTDTQMFERKILQSNGNLESNFILKFSQTSRDFTGYYGLKFTSLNGSVKLVKSVILEGDYTNTDIPYFEGTQSVKMPVLTTSNEDGTKSIILSTPSDLELRGIGEVRDELNCLTGEDVQRVSEFIIDENTTITKYTDIEGFNTTGYNVKHPTNFVPSTTNFICNSLQKSTYEKIQPNMSPVDEEGIAVNSGYIKFRVSNEKGDNVEDFKKYLGVNPIKLIIPLVEESIKTVDLTVVNQDGESLSKIKPIEGIMHLSTSGETVKPLFNGDIPVEAITQNLASFIEE